MSLGRRRHTFHTGREPIAEGIYRECVNCGNKQISVRTRASKNGRKGGRLKWVNTTPAIKTGTAAPSL